MGSLRRLPPRLRSVAELVPPEGAVADVGSGDGLLAAWLAARGRRVVATDNKPGPLAVIRRALAEMPVEMPVETREGDGLLPLAPGEVELVVIAGLGGRAIRRILALSPAVVGQLKALILQPVQHLEELTDYLAAEGFQHRDAREAWQGRHRYSTLLVVPPYSSPR